MLPKKGRMGLPLVSKEVFAEYCFRELFEGRSYCLKGKKVQACNLNETYILVILKSGLIIFSSCLQAFLCARIHCLINQVWFFKTFWQGRRVSFLKGLGISSSSCQDSKWLWPPSILQHRMPERGSSSLFCCKTQTWPQWSSTVCHDARGDFAYVTCSLHQFCLAGIMQWQREGSLLLSPMPVPPGTSSRCREVSSSHRQSMPTGPTMLLLAKKICSENNSIEDMWSCSTPFFCKISVVHSQVLFPSAFIPPTAGCFAKPRLKKYWVSWC